MKAINSLTFLSDKKSKDFRNYIDILIMKKIHLVCFVLFISAVSLFGVTEGRIPSSREMNNTRTEIRRLYTNGNYQSVVTASTVTAVPVGTSATITITNGTFTFNGTNYTKI